MKHFIFLLPLAFCLVVQAKAEPLPEELALDVQTLSDALVDLHAELIADELIYAQIQANTYDGHKDIVAAIFTIGGWVVEIARPNISPCLISMTLTKAPLRKMNTV